MDRSATSRALNQELGSFAKQQVSARTVRRRSLQKRLLAERSTPGVASKTGVLSMPEYGLIRISRHRVELTLATYIHHSHADPSPGGMVYCMFTRSLANRKCLSERLACHHKPVTTIDELWHCAEATWASVPVHAI
ncbi:hypothetical protein TNCV_3947981 [Trichonephila clavipes]|nr:hypothetical protein TNCV_3947981 [Trichonephila clavipes]